MLWQLVPPVSSLPSVPSLPSLAGLIVELVVTSIIITVLKRPRRAVGGVSVSDSVCGHQCHGYAWRAFLLCERSMSERTALEGLCTPVRTALEGLCTLVFTANCRSWRLSRLVHRR